MWLTCSSVGRKLVMAITGACLVLFVTFHCLMNGVALFWPTGYNAVCEFLGANWYALVATVGLAALFIIHIIYALWLTVQNRKARGNDRYVVTATPKGVEWSSQNMLVLGIVVLAFLVVHLIQFWAKMQWQELRHADLDVLPQLQGVPCAPAMGTLFLQIAFSEVWTPIVYIIGFIALWFHMTHGFWSMFHTIGWDNNKWIGRLKTIGCWWASIVVALFIAQAIVFTVHAHNDYYINNADLQKQYAEFWNEQAADLLTDFQDSYYAAIKATEGQPDQMRQQAFNQFVADQMPAFIQRGQYIANGFEKQCFNITPSEEMNELGRFVQQMQMAVMQVAMQSQQPAQAAPAEAAPVAIEETQDIN